MASKSITVVLGFHKKAFGIGFHIDSWMLSLDFGFFYIGVEW